MANKSRPKQVMFRMSEEEYEKFMAKVEQSGMKQQEYILKSVLNKPVMNTDGLKELFPELRKQGSNLNQIARELNTYGSSHYPSHIIEKNQKELNEIWQLLKQYLQKQA